MEKNNCQEIFLATEDSSVAELFKQRFKDKVIMQDITRFEPNIPVWLPEFVHKNHDSKQISLDYLADIYLLSQCDAYISSYVSAGVFPMLIKENEFDEVYFYDCEKYQ